MKKLNEYRVVILDVDGTLYYQGMLQAIMATMLLKHIVLCPSGLADVRIISTFRRFRETLQLKEYDLDTYQYSVVADELGVKFDKVKAVIDRWVCREPLPYLRICRDEKLATIIRSLRLAGRTTVAYSDYPATSKLAKLGLEVDFVFCATDPQINCLKPSSKGLIAILNQLSCSPEDCVFIGDRDDKDGECARGAGLDFIILPKLWLARRRLYAQSAFTIS